MWISKKELKKEIEHLRKTVELLTMKIAGLEAILDRQEREDARSDIDRMMR